MGFQVSPGVNVSEYSVDSVVPGTSTQIGGHVGPFQWGPVLQLNTIGSENELVARHGKPNNDTAVSFFLAANYLGYSDNLKNVRVVGANAKNAASGGDGAGLTLNVVAVNGQLVSAAIVSGGTNYIVGDLVRIVSTVADARVRVKAVSAGGVVTQVELVGAGEGLATNATQATVIVDAVYVGNEDDLQNDTIFPEVIARYPGALGNSLSFSAVRASEFDSWAYRDRFVVPPTASTWKWSGDGSTLAFTLPGGATALPTDGIVVVDGIKRTAGVNPGQYGVSGGVLTFVEATEQFSGNSATYNFTLTNTNGLDPSQARVKVGTATKARYTGTGIVPEGSFKIVGNAIELGIGRAYFGGNGVTTVFTILGRTGLADAKVKVNGVTKTVITTGTVAAGQALVQDSGGNTTVTFFASEAPSNGIGNVEVLFAFPPTAVNNIEVKYGAPHTEVDNVKVFYNQTEIHAVVIDEGGLWTGETEALIERYDFLSLIPGAKKPDGTTAFYVDAINRRSDKVWIPGVLYSYGTKRLTGGVDDNGVGITPGKIQEGWNLFRDGENIDVSHVIGGAPDAATAIWLIGNLTEFRKDCVVYISPPMNAVVNNRGNEIRDCKAFRDQLPSTSYGFMDCNWKWQYDRYNDTFRWIPCSADSAGLYAQIADSQDAWFPAAGPDTGKIKNAVKLAWSPNKTARDELYPNGINPITWFRNEGPLLYGDKTMLSKPDAFDRMNVRWLFIVVEKSISRAARYYLFKINDTFTRNQFKNTVQPFLRDVKGRRGIYDYYVVCDESNNPGSVVDRNEFVGDIYIKPARSINYIQLNFIAVGTDTNFEEIVGSFN